MKIVRALMNDVPRILECARQFTSIIPDCKLDEQHYQSIWEEFILNGQGAIFLVVDDSGEVAGGIGGVKHADLLTGEMLAVELFWYMKPEHRKGLWSVRLLRKFEEWAKTSGCAHTSMIHMECSMPEKLKEFYARQGYTLLETVYRKRI